MLAKTKSSKSKQVTVNDNSEEDILKLGVSRIKMTDYELHHYYKDKIKDLALSFGEICTTSSADLDQVRALILKIQENNNCSNPNGWCFVDAVTAGRFFRIDRGQENLHYVLDICDGSTLFILDEDNHQEEEDEGTAEEALTKGVVIPEEEENNNRDSCRPESTKDKPTINNDQVLEKTTEGVLKAARLGDLRMLSELHGQGYSLLSIDETGKTALHYGARFGHKDVVRFLIDNAPISILDMVDNEKGQTALHKASAYKRRTICCLLIAAGASLLIQDHASLTPRQLAVMAEDQDLADYLDSQEQFQANKLPGLGDQNDLDIETPV